MKTRGLALALAATTLVLAGCTPSTEPSASPSTDLSASPSAEPSTAPSPTDTSGPSPTDTSASGTDCLFFDPASEGMGQPAIDFNRFAGICVGMSFPEAEAASFMDVSGVPECPWVATVVSDDDIGLYVNAISDNEEPGAEIRFFVMYWFGDPVDASSYEMPALESGVTIGTTEGTLLVEYPTAEQIIFDDISRGERYQRVVAGPDGTSINFDIVDGYVSEISWGWGLGDGGPNGELCAL